MAKGADRDMQKLFPEGFMFMNALYGISCAELATNTKGAIAEDAYEESYRCFVKMNTAEARSIFDEYLLLPYGAYYQGWSTYQLGCLIEAGQNKPADTALENLFKFRCDRIAKAVEYGQIPYLESYIGYTWPADMVVCIAALSLHDRLFVPQYKAIIKRWISAVHTHLDNKGMMPHSVDAFDNYPTQAAQGNSLGLMLCFLKQIDTELYAQQYNLYKKFFIESRFGLPGIREYPVGIQGEGDIDSGPVILGIGGAASIVGLRVLATEKDPQHAVALRNSIEAFGMPTQGNKTKKYLFGVLPMADVFIFWANSTEQTQDAELTTAFKWRATFQIYSGIALLLMIFLIGFIWKN